MDNQQQQRINAAAQQFTDALVAASRATSDRSVAAQKLGTQMTRYFFNSVMNNLRTQAEGTRQVTRRLADQQRRAQEVTREFTQVSANTYMNLLDSISSFYQGGTTRAQRRAEEAERSSSEGESPGGDDFPLADYDSLNIRQISERLDELSVEEIRRLRDYEVRNKDRSTLVNRLNSRIEVSS
jgi:hypothetical protein